MRIRRSSKCAFATAARSTTSCSAPSNASSRARKPGTERGAAGMRTPAASTRSRCRCDCTWPMARAPRASGRSPRRCAARARPHPHDAEARRVRCATARSRSARRSRRCTASTSWRRTNRAWCWSTCTPRTSACCTKSSRRRRARVATQLLLAPVTVELKVDELDALMAQREEWQRRGVRPRAARARRRWWCARCRRMLPREDIAALVRDVVGDVADGRRHASSRRRHRPVVRHHRLPLGDPRAPPAHAAGDECAAAADGADAARRPVQSRPPDLDAGELPSSIACSCAAADAAHAADRGADRPDGHGQERHRAARWRASFRIEIVSVDSAQVYRGLDIGSAKPDARNRARRAASPDRPGRARARVIRRGSSCAMPRDAIDDIEARGRVPLLVGGTMLYLRALIGGIADLPEGSEQIRARHRCGGRDARLAGAARAPGDGGCGRRGAHPSQRCAAHPARARGARGRRASRSRRCRRRPRSPLDARVPRAPRSIPQDRARLHAALAQRFEQMMAAGLLEEVRAAVCARRSDR